MDGSGFTPMSRSRKEVRQEVFVVISTAQNYGEASPCKSHVGCGHIVQRFEMCAVVMRQLALMFTRRSQQFPNARFQSIPTIQRSRADQIRPQYIVE
jgi:hypothetical protein